MLEFDVMLVATHLFAMCVIGVISLYIGVFIQRNKEYTVPIVFGVLYGFYVLIIKPSPFTK